MAINEVLSEGIDFSRYAGQWVVICENKLIAHDKNLSKMDKAIKECKRTPTIAKIPKKGTLIF